MKVQFFKDIYTFKLLHTFEFNSTRKRQSVIVQDLKSNEIYLMSKGADSILFERTDESKSSKVVETKQNLENYGVIGLRTLLLCQRKIIN